MRRGERGQNVLMLRSHPQDGVSKHLVGVGWNLGSQQSAKRASRAPQPPIFAMISSEIS